MKVKTKLMMAVVLGIVLGVVVEPIRSFVSGLFAGSLGTTNGEG